MNLAPSPARMLCPPLFWSSHVHVPPRPRSLTGAIITIKHVKAYTLDNGDTEQRMTATLETRLNQKADDKARRVRTDPADPSWIQYPLQLTFLMEEWMIWTKEEGYCQDGCDGKSEQR